LKSCRKPFANYPLLHELAEEQSALQNVAIAAGGKPAVATYDLTTTPALQTVDHFGRNFKNTPPLHFTSTTFEHICSAAKRPQA
jgi:hypothetical protein